ncbi:hypothetical protein PYCCODRAFT_552184 [Trametes coccinea BRFM310]|uniref:Uncharacterized protein n=1 Tax=Trametes coccinea (strain BRFM310) TaxID=1353009 RepID=A0A1Y2IKQ0_TRAC3|nr:hypothetical protein PYCCODRAFT_552184 [Trametes coccinea BRFM310]
MSRHLARHDQLTTLTPSSLPCPTYASDLNLFLHIPPLGASFTSSAQASHHTSRLTASATDHRLSTSRTTNRHTTPTILYASRNRPVLHRSSRARLSSCTYPLSTPEKSLTTHEIRSRRSYQQRRNVYNRVTRLDVCPASSTASLHFIFMASILGKGVSQRRKGASTFFQWEEVHVCLLLDYSALLLFFALLLPLFEIFFRSFVRSLTVSPGNAPGRLRRSNTIIVITMITADHDAPTASIEPCRSHCRH